MRSYTGASITNNTFVNNSTALSGSGPRTVFNNNFINSSRYAIYNGDSSLLASNNYWGTTNTTLIDQMIYDMNDNVLYGLVTYTPILTAPVTTAPAFLSNVTISPASPVSLGTVNDHA